MSEPGLVKGLGPIPGSLTTIARAACFLLLLYLFFSSIELMGVAFYGMLRLIPLAYIILT